MSDQITIETIAAAETLLGVRYTAAERQLMVGNLAGQIESARARRALTLANSVPMAARFDPRLPGFPAPPPQRPLRPSARRSGAAARGRRGHRVRPRDPPLAMDRAAENSRAGG